MLFPIPIGYFVSVFLLISGVLNCMEYLAEKPADCSRAVLLNGLAEAGWPIIVASVILLLIQLNQQMEKLRLVATVEPPHPASKPQKKKKYPAEVDAEPHKAGRAEPAPAVSLAGLAGAAQPQAPMKPTMRGQATPAPHMPTYPNSPIPGGGRVPQQAAAPAAESHPEPVSDPRGAKRAPSKAEAESLSFFKVD